MKKYYSVCCRNVHFRMNIHPCQLDIGIYTPVTWTLDSVPWVACNSSQHLQQLQHQHPKNITLKPPWQSVSSTWLNRWRIVGPRSPQVWRPTKPYLSSALSFKSEVSSHIKLCSHSSWKLCHPPKTQVEFVSQEGMELCQVHLRSQNCRHLFTSRQWSRFQKQDF